MADNPRSKETHDLSLERGKMFFTEFEHEVVIGNR
jgi:hypothetical protein